MIVNFLRFQIRVGERRSCGRSFSSEDPTDDSLGEGVRIESSTADMRSKVINQYFIWFVYLLKYVSENLLDLALLKWSGLSIVTNKLPESVFQIIWMSNLIYVDSF